ncbi:hypothetical protein ACFQE1_10285 [Halobium palmae]|uniref:SPW repeat-containing protein n=1 Tax=Halobium palmae TaxID=1776492 RepID=A0ABD5S0S5_9EURY
MNRAQRRFLLGPAPTERRTFGFGLLTLCFGGFLLFALWLENETNGLVGGLTLVAGAVVLLLAWAAADGRIDVAIGPHLLAGVGTATVGVGLGLAFASSGPDSPPLVGLAAVLALQHVVRGAWIARTRAGFSGPEP